MRIYIAGPYSSSSYLQVLKNQKAGMRLAASLIKQGHSPFCPFLDYPLSFFEDLTIAEYYRYSMDWLTVSDAVAILPGWEDSRGTLAELERARQCGIWVYPAYDAVISGTPPRLSTDEWEEHFYKIMGLEPRPWTSVEDVAKRFKEKK